MVKGCQRRVIMVRGTGSGMFDEAYFFLKPEKADLPETLMITEANRIIEENRLRSERKLHLGETLRRRVWCFLLGVGTGSGTVALLWMLGG